MFELRVNAHSICVIESELIVSGSIDIYNVKFDFSEEWDGLVKVAVFTAGRASIEQDILLANKNTCIIPWEVLAYPHGNLWVGVYGVDEEGYTIRPTITTDIGPVVKGVKPGSKSVPPSPDIYEQILAELSTIPKEMTPEELRAILTGEVV